MVKNPPANEGSTGGIGSIPGAGRSPEKKTATHSSVLAWRIPGAGEPDRLPSMGSQSQTQLKRLSSSSILFKTI